jgi:uncharacterized protein YqfA (UPF0365 family)
VPLSFLYAKLVSSALNLSPALAENLAEENLSVPLSLTEKLSKANSSVPLSFLENLADGKSWAQLFTIAQISSPLDQASVSFSPTSTTLWQNSLWQNSGMMAQASETAQLIWILFWVGLAILGMFFLGLFFAFLTYGKLWFQAFMSSANVSMMSLIGMHFRKVRAQVIVTAKIMAKQAGLDIGKNGGITTDMLEAHYLAGGDVMRVINAIIAAQRANIDLDFDRAAAIDLAGRDVMDAVKTSVYPKVIDCPDPVRSGKNVLSAMAKDGVELRIRARVTVRTNLEQLIGGATEETIIARVGESIISSIGSSDRHQDVLENPDRISRAVLERGLDAHTAFEIVSIDIADIDVGENIGARLQADQAEADTRVAQAAAEKRRAEAIAHEQEMKADVAFRRAMLVESEANVPRAMAEAFRKGNIVNTKVG